MLDAFYSHPIRKCLILIEARHVDVDWNGKSRHYTFVNFLDGRHHKLEPSTRDCPTYVCGPFGLMVY